ncbi:MAG TPA: hypothetical protein VJX30_20950, partial [Terriglobales bacterium]|nr:hypothetical protein [Terriglobales bacterium]
MESHRLRVARGRVSIRPIGEWRSAPTEARAKAPRKTFNIIRPGKTGTARPTIWIVIRTMNLKSLLLSSDERTVRVLRRVLSDLE